MKKTVKIDIASYDLNESNLDNLASEFCGAVAALIGKGTRSSHEIVFSDDVTDPRPGEEPELLKSEDNAALFRHALTRFKLKP